MNCNITPFLWFDHQGEDAVNFYRTLFPQAKLSEITRYGSGNPLPGGTLRSATLEIFGQRLYIFNGGPYFQFSGAISLMVNCETQDEIDYLWAGLSSGGEPMQCGWIKDRFGLTWQIVPSQLSSLISGTDRIKSQRAMQAMLKMIKLDLPALQRAYDGDESV